MVCFFFFNDTATTEIYTLSLHDALPIFRERQRHRAAGADLGVQGLLGQRRRRVRGPHRRLPRGDWKSTPLNSHHAHIPYRVFSLKKKNTHLDYALVPLSVRSIQLLAFET